jgi:hypothetical protein
LNPNNKKIKSTSNQNRKSKPILLPSTSEIPVAFSNVHSNIIEMKETSDEKIQNTSSSLAAGYKSPPPPPIMLYPSINLLPEQKIKSDGRARNAFKKQIDPLLKQQNIETYLKKFNSFCKKYFGENDHFLLIAYRHEPTETDDPTKLNPIVRITPYPCNGHNMLLQSSNAVEKICSDCIRTHVAFRYQTQRPMVATLVSKNDQIDPTNYQLQPQLNVNTSNYDIDAEKAEQLLLLNNVVISIDHALEQIKLRVATQTELIEAEQNNVICETVKNELACDVGKRKTIARSYLKVVAAKVSTNLL